MAYPCVTLAVPGRSSGTIPPGLGGGRGNSFASEARFSLRELKIQGGGTHLVVLPFRGLSTHVMGFTRLNLLLTSSPQGFVLHAPGQEPPPQMERRRQS